MVVGLINVHKRPYVKQKKTYFHLLIFFLTVYICVSLSFACSACASMSVCICVYVCLSVCLWSTAQYEAEAVDVEVCVNSQLHRRRLTYSFSSLDVASQLSAFYSRLLDVACQHHHHHHHHHQQQQQQQQQQQASESSISALDEALAKTIDEDMSASVRQSLFAVYRHCTSN